MVADRVAGFQGPLAGVEAGLTWAAGAYPGVSWAVTVPGDTPFIPFDLVARLAEGIVAKDTMAIATSQAGVHPVVGLWPLAMAAPLARSLAEGQRRASRWAERQGAAEVFFEDAEIGNTRVDPFFNVNRPEDLAEAEALLKGKPERS